MHPFSPLTNIDSSLPTSVKHARGARAHARLIEELAYLQQWVIHLNSIIGW